MFTNRVREYWLPASNKHYTESTPLRFETVKEANNECLIHSANTKVNYQIINDESLEFGIAGFKKKKSLCMSQNH